MAGAGMGLLGGWWLLLKKKVNLAKATLFAVVIFGILSIVIMVPGSIPDEVRHIATAYRYSNVLLLKPYAAEEGGLLARAGDVPLDLYARYTTPYLGAYQEIAADWDWFYSSQQQALITTEGDNVPSLFISYLPAAIGMALARLMHLGKWPMIYLGRLCNLAAFAAMVYWAVKLTPVKKHLFCLLGLIPACVQAAGSYSYDAPTLGLTFLVLAGCLRLIFTTPAIRWREWLLCCAAAFLLFPCKLIYSSVFLLLILVPREKAGGMPKKLLFLASVIISGLVGFLCSNFEQVLVYLHSLGTPSRANDITAVEVYSLGIIFTRPLDVLQMMIRSIRDNFTFYWEGAFIARLTRFDLRLAWGLVLLIAYLLAGMQDEQDTLVLSGRQRLTCLAAFLLTATAAFLIMIDYTPLGSQSILGVQGRYFTPVLPLLLLALGNAQLRINDSVKRWLTVLIIACNSSVLGDLLHWIVLNQINGI